MSHHWKRPIPVLLSLVLLSNGHVLPLKAGSQSLVASYGKKHATGLDLSNKWKDNAVKPSQPGQVQVRPTSRIYFPDNLPGGARTRRPKTNSPGFESPKLKSPVPSSKGCLQSTPCRPSTWFEALIDAVESKLNSDPAFPTIVEFPVDESTIVFDETAGEAPPEGAVPYDWLLRWLRRNFRPVGIRLPGKVSRSRIRAVMLQQGRLSEETYKKLYEALVGPISRNALSRGSESRSY